MSLNPADRSKQTSLQKQWLFLPFILLMSSADLTGMAMPAGGTCHAIYVSVLEKQPFTSFYVVLVVPNIHTTGKYKLNSLCDQMSSQKPT